jgi:hypothetical protein
MSLLRFKEFFLEEVSFKRARKIQNQFKKIFKYSPGTFGFDIEFDYQNELDLDGGYYASITNWANNIKRTPHLYDKFLKWFQTHPEFKSKKTALLMYAQKTFDDLTKEESEKFTPNTENKIEQYTEMLRGLGEKVNDGFDDVDFTKEWVVNMDEGGQPEIASRILTTEDFPLLKRFFKELRGEETSAGTSAHIHIGVPENFDMFSLLALYFLVDEKYIQEILPKRDFAKWAELSSNLRRVFSVNISAFVNSNYAKMIKVEYKNPKKTIYMTPNMLNRLHIKTYRVKIDNSTGEEIEDDNLKEVQKLLKDSDVESIDFDKWNDDGETYGKHPDFTFEEIDKKEISDGVWEIEEGILTHWLKSVEKKMNGVNTTYFDKRKTIEFRYLSSEILDKPSNFLRFIRYFLLLPEIASRTKKLELDKWRLQKQGNKIRIIRK